MLADEAVAMANEVAAAIAAANGTASSSAPIHGAIACVASPSVFRVLAARRLPNRIVLFEFDKRFAALYGDAFSFYDVNHPLSVDRQHVGAFDFVIADPPYLVCAFCVCVYEFFICQMLVFAYTLVSLRPLNCIRHVCAFHIEIRVHHVSA
jgi:hypothetical protein